MEVTTRMARHGRADVLASAAAGDEVAFRHIIAAHHEDMRRVCLAICGDHAIADEATQSAWFIAWKKIDKVYDQDRLRPWLVSVAANEAKKLLTKHRRRAAFEAAFDVATEQGAADPATGVAEIDLDAAMSRLDPDDRALLAMRYVVGFDSNELARATGISPSGTRSRIERALKRLRKDLSDG
jgi:RNA polymerase sigma-70 factor (ECF subfamily)